MQDLEQVDYDKLKARCAELNENLDEPFAVVGVSKEVLITQFANGVETLDEETLDKDEMAEVVTFYNWLFADEAVKTEGAETPEQEEEAGEEEAAAPPEKEKKKEKKEKKKGDGEDKPKKKRRGPVPYTNFQELSTWLKEQQTPTSAMDRLLLEGGKIPDIVEKFKGIAEQSGYKGFKTASSVKSHIQYREKKGWVYDYAGEGDEQTIRLVGFER